MNLKIGTTNEPARHDWVTRALAQLPDGARLLDAGAGTQRYRGACSHLSYVAQDLAEYDGQGDGRGGQAKGWHFDGVQLKCDIVDMPVDDASFDAVLCTEVIEHVPDPLAAITEMARVLRPGGTLLLTAPFVSFSHFSPYHYCTGFSRYFYETHLPALGLTIQHLEPNGGFFDFVAQELRRVPATSKRYARPLRFWERWLIHAAVGVLDRVARHDRNSSEFATFGYHIHAVKAQPAAAANAA